MKVEITESGVVLCDSMPCPNYDNVDVSCGNCPIQAIISKAIANDPLVYLTEYIN